MYVCAERRTLLRVKDRVGIAVPRLCKDFTVLLSEGMLDWLSNQSGQYRSMSLCGFPGSGERSDQQYKINCEWPVGARLGICGRPE